MGLEESYTGDRALGAWGELGLRAFGVLEFWGLGRRALGC